MGGNSRLSNFELYRIIVMLLIVAHHYVVNSGVEPLMAENPLAAKSIFLYLLGMWGKTGINCFVLITGYFMCKKQITLRKFLKLLLEVEFYNDASQLKHNLINLDKVYLQYCAGTLAATKGWHSCRE